MQRLFRNQERRFGLLPGRQRQPDVPDELWEKCAGCGEMIYLAEFEQNAHVCPKCDHHARLSARKRVQFLLDPDTFAERDSTMRSQDILNFERPERSYEQKLEDEAGKAGIPESVIYGTGTIRGEDVVLAVIDTNFFMATMGSVVGEKITRAIELATETRTPLVIVAASAGARMEEGMFSLMQMAKTSAALTRLHEARVLYVSVLTDPTLAGVTASFATLADVIIAEPQATIGFTGPRLIEQITHAKLPAGTHSAEFMIERGMVDCIVPRNDLRRTLARLSGLYSSQTNNPSTDGMPLSDNGVRAKATS
ncbi:MAG: acetyl-CoA carboxylase, carboxyltransferase subunit beta [Chloroflexota bacterium]|nr:acetyl-CoA carboxylase, carboxyltransferase subunit beta [Chloroflexota bacterium]MDE2839096.1 acetyl-CoA carboxylase, carboxyltransferase subunit beta [Chloroflexota bacterium]MDE2931009.1 acetyl-CoA carboxylase, carboxyltransferase subunit beta [Chloroflexota bacterium]